MSLLRKIKDFLKKCWNLIKKIFRKIVNWINDILNFFKSKIKSKKLGKKIRNGLDSGDYNVCECLNISIKDDDNYISNVIYDDKRYEIITIESLNIEFNSLDNETADAFKNHNMILFN